MQLEDVYATIERLEIGRSAQPLHDSEDITSHLKGVSISIAGACIRFGRAGNGSDFDSTLDRFCKFDLAGRCFTGL
jgi:hypothetical protein